MKRPSVSILLPARNAAHTLPEAADSLREQTLEDWECVIVDDGSADATAEIGARLAREDARFSLIRNPGRGLPQALNAGLARCRAPLVARMDADDRCLPRRLELQAELLDSTPRLALASCLVRCFTTDGAPVPEGMALYEQWINSVVSPADIERDFFVESPFAHPSVMFRKRAALDAGGYMDRGWPEDYDLWMRLRLNGAQFAKVPEILFEWRDTPARVSRTHRDYSPVAFKKLKAFYLLQTYLKGRGGVTIWGAGRGGRWWAAELAASGVRTRRFVDIDPRKIGRARAGAPVIAPGDLLPAQEGDFILCAVESRGARPLIRDALLRMGFEELRDFVFVA